MGKRWGRSFFSPSSGRKKGGNLKPSFLPGGKSGGEIFFAERNKVIRTPRLPG